jgi:hypothetical protein
LFERYIGIDYSGAETAGRRLKGLSVYLSDREGPPCEVAAPAGGKHWTRRQVAEWLAARLAEESATLAGIDHGFSFPAAYFKKYGLSGDWTEFLEDFRRHWPTDDDHMYVDFVRDGLYGDAAGRSGSRLWRRVAEVRAGGAKSVFHFDVPGQVAKATHAGLPWLLWLRRQSGVRAHFWPFDGWEVPAGRSVVAEVYPALWNRRFAREGRDDHRQDAYSIARWMCEADADGSLAGYLRPDLGPAEERAARVEGWILGVA